MKFNSSTILIFFLTLVVLFANPSLIPSRVRAGDAVDFETLKLYLKGTLSSKNKKSRLNAINTLKDLGARVADFSAPELIRLADEDPDEEVRKQAQATLKKLPEWVTISPKGARFNIMLPGKPKEDNKRSETGSRAMTWISLNSQFGQAEYGVMAKTWEGAVFATEVKEKLAELESGFQKAYDGAKKKSTKNIKQNRTLGLETVYEMPDGKQFAKVRFFASDKCQDEFSVVAIGTKEFIESEPTDQFFDSFRLKLVAVDEKEWQLLNPRGGDFSVKMRSSVKPERLTGNIETAIGKVDMHFYGLSDDKTNTISVSYCEYPKGTVAKVNIKKLLQNQQDVMVSEKKLLSTKVIRVQGHIGRDFTVEFPKDGLTRYRVLYVGDRMYVILATGDQEFMESEDIDTFFDSFSLSE